MRRIASILIVLAAASAVVALTGARTPRETKGTKFHIVFDNAFGLTEGGDLRVGGVKAGKTMKMDVTTCRDRTPDDGPPRTCAVVESVITEKGFEDFKTDATCDIRQQSLIGEYYVDCQPGDNEQSLANGAKIPNTQTRSTIPPDLVNDILRRPYRDRLRLIIAELGTGLAGRPQDVAELLRKAHPGLRQTRRVLKILGDQRTTIKNFISNSNTVVRELDQRKRDLQDWLVQASRAADVSASRRDDIARGFERLPTFLDELNGTMVRLEQLTDAQTPLLTDLRQAAPSLNTFLTRLGPFSEASRPAIRSLGTVSRVGTRAFLNAREELVMLNAAAKDAPSAAKPLRQFLQTMDNRDRATETTNNEAAASAPPAPDPASIARSKKKKKGFTGMEAILNYFYWQALALNQFDSISHVLRAVGIQDPKCSVFLNDLRSDDEDHGRPARERCNSWLGPNQPGVTTPDIPPDSAAVGRTPAKRRGERRGRGEPEAGPLPGQRDYSRPNPTLSASQRELLDSVRRGQIPQGPSAPGVPQVPGVPSVPSAPSPEAPGAAASGSVGQALDYLLGP